MGYPVSNHRPTEYISDLLKTSDGSLIPSNVIPSKSVLYPGFVLIVQAKGHPLSPRSAYLIFQVRDFEKYLTAGPGAKWYGLDECLDASLEGIGPFEGTEVVEVYQLSTDPQYAFTSLIASRPILWARKRAKKMTVAEISKELGYEVEVVEG